MFFKILVAALTGIGGHYLNRRWDRAILFLFFFIVWPLAVYAWLYLNPRGGTFAGFEEAKRIAILALGAGVTLLWLLSLFVTRRDAGRRDRDTVRRWTVSGVLGALLTTTLTTFCLIGTVLLVVDTVERTDLAEPTAKHGSSSVKSGNRFFTNVYFGGGTSGAHDNPEPPTGDGILKGRITLDGEPAAGVRLSLDLNAEFRARNLVTDESGVFSLALEPGPWWINAVQTETWPDRPEGEHFSLYFEGQPKLVDDTYDRYAHVVKSGYQVKVTGEASEPHLELIIREDLEMQWPDWRHEKRPAGITDAVAWQHHPGASRYLVEVSRVTHDGEVTTYYPVAERLLEGKTRLELTELPHVPSGEQREYSVHVYAFAEDGTLVAESPGAFRSGTFVLTDGTALVKEEDFSPAVTVESPED